jgi:molybdopterin synthase catalytic subunit
MRIVAVQTEPLSLADADALSAGRTDVGAVCAFVGRVRAANEGDAVSALELEHYPGMTEAAMAAICAEAEGRWPLTGLMAIHRVGRLEPGAPIVLVAAASAHRDAAFEAARFVMDALKTDAPFWKKETGPAIDRWLDARASDAEARARWTITE